MQGKEVRISHSCNGSHRLRGERCHDFVSIGPRGDFVLRWLSAFIIGRPVAP